MPNIEIPIRSLSILFIIGAITAILGFPDNPATPELSRALFWWFLALGVVRWVDDGLRFLLRDREGNIHKNLVWLSYTSAILSFVLQVWFLVNGIRCFFLYYQTYNRTSNNNSS